MNTKLNTIDDVATESNVLIKHLLDSLKISSTRGAKRDQPDKATVMRISMPIWALVRKTPNSGAPRWAKFNKW